MQNERFEKEFQVKAYFVFGFAMYVFFYRLISGTMYAQMFAPPFLFEEKEWIYKALLASGIPQFITSHSFVASVFDISLLVFTLAFLLTFKRVYAIVFSVLVVLYFCTFNMVTGHHYHGLVGVMVMTIPFWFKSEKRFEFSWQAARYYFLYIFSTAALWKIVRGSVFYHEQLSNILKSQQIDLLIQKPDSFRADIARYLIAHADVSHALLIGDVVLQLSFMVGFFTRKYDRFLFWLMIVFCVANYYTMGIYSAELLIFNFTLLNWEKVMNYLGKKGLLTA